MLDPGFSSSVWYLVTSQPAYLAIHPLLLFMSINGYLEKHREHKLWLPGCHFITALSDKDELQGHVFGCVAPILPYQVSDICCRLTGNKLPLLLCHIWSSL